MHVVSCVIPEMYRCSLLTQTGISSVSEERSADADVEHDDVSSSSSSSSRFFLMLRQASWCLKGDIKGDTYMNKGFLLKLVVIIIYDTLQNLVHDRAIKNYYVVFKHTLKIFLHIR